MAILLENYIFEENKVKGQTHYTVCKLKIFLILMQEDLWEIVEPSVVQVSYSIFGVSTFGIAPPTLLVLLVAQVENLCK